MTITDNYLAEWGLTPEDDKFHLRDSNPWWTETWWNAWMVPERKMLGYFYPVFRPNVGVLAGGVILFDDTAEFGVRTRTAGCPAAGATSAPPPPAYDRFRHVRSRPPTASFCARKRPAAGRSRAKNGLSA
jgi:hypothetical protein